VGAFRLTFFGELKRRNVFRVGIAYLALAWLLTEVAGTLFPAFGIPDWGVRFIVIVFALGFVPTLIISWVYELTPEGIKREKDVEREVSIVHHTATRLDLIIISLIVVALGFVAADRLWLSPRLDYSSEIVVETAPRSPQSTEPESLPTPDSIAVLPFANRSANPDDMFFVDGVHDDLLTHISRIGAFKTISRTSVMKYRDTTLSIPHIARELDVATVLEGGVQRVGDQVRINVQLIDARTDDHLWSQIYDRRLTATNVFAIQSEIAELVAQALRAELTPEAKAQLSSVPTENLEALEQYFQGRQKMDTRLVADLFLAVQHFEKAIELDPSFALAHAKLAYSSALYSQYASRSAGMEETERQAWLEKSRLAAEKARQLDSRLAEAHTAIGLNKWYRGDMEGAEAAFMQALQLNPNEPQANQWLGMVISGRADRAQEALEYSLRAVTLDPMSAIILCDYGDVLTGAGRFDEALAQYQQAVAIEPRFSKGYRRLGDLAVRSGRLDQAILALRKAQAIEPDESQAPSRLGDVYLSLGDDQQAEHWYKIAMRQSSGEEQKVGTNLGRLYLHRGDTHQAREYLKTVLQANPKDQRALYLLVNLDLAEGDIPGALSRYQLAYPGLFDDQPTVDISNRSTAIHLAAVHSIAEEQGRKEQLLGLAWQNAKSHEPRSYLDEASIHALRGDDQAALDALGKVDTLEKNLYWRELVFGHPAFQSLMGNPEFQALDDTFKSEIDRQLALVQELEASGQLDPLPYR
jgi:TolB-like protein/tetratricopeptide (TPR) repeat protein